MNQEAERMMISMAEVAAQWMEDRQKLQTQLERLKSGKVKPGEWSSGGDLIDTTADSIETYERCIGELDALIARHSDGKQASAADLTVLRRW